MQGTTGDVDDIADAYFHNAALAGEDNAKALFDTAFDCIPMRKALGDKGTEMRRKCRNILRLKTRVKSRTVGPARVKAVRAEGCSCIRKGYSGAGKCWASGSSGRKPRGLAGKLNPNRRDSITLPCLQVLPVAPKRRQAVSVEGYFCRRESFRNLGPHDNVLRVGE